MNALEFFLLRYRDLAHRMERLGDLSEEHWRARPHGLNSIAWVVWHIARCEDVAVNRFVVDARQVHEERAWCEQLGIDRRDIGTGMSSDEVDDFSARVVLPALRGYWASVVDRTFSVVADLRPDDLDAVVVPEYVRRVIAEERLLGPRAEFVETNFTGKSKGWFLAQLALTHNYAHWYGVEIVRGLLGFRGR